MPTAPMGQRQVMDQAAPGVRVQAAPTAHIYGDGIGDTVASASVRMYDLETRSADHAQVLEAERITNDHVLAIQNELQTKYSGKQASQAPDYAKEEMSAASGEVMAGLSNDRQRAMYNAIAIQKAQALDRFALQHFQSENEKYKDDVYKAGLNSSINFAKANAGDDNMVATEKGNQAHMVALRAAELGMDSATAVAELEHVHSKTNTEVIQSRLNAGQDIKAKEYYDKMIEMESSKDNVDKVTGKVTYRPGMIQFTAQDRDVVDKAMQEGSTRGASRRVASDLVSRGIDTAEDRKARIDELGGMADSGKISDKVYDLARQRIEHDFSANDQMQNQVKDERFKGAIAGIDEQLKAGNKLPPLEMVKPSDLAEMSVGERHTIETYVNRRRDPGKVVTDLPTMINLYAMKDEDLAKIGKREMTALVMKLDDGDGKSVMTRWNGAINAKSGQKDVKYEQMYSNKELFDKALRRSGYFDMETPMSKWSPEKQRLMLKADQEAALAVGTLKEGASAEEIMAVQKKVIDENIGEKFKVKPSFFRFEKDVAAGSIGDYKDARSIRIPMADIPVDRQNELKGALKSAGMPTTQENIEALEARARMKKQGIK